MKHLPAHKIKEYLKRPDAEIDFHGLTRVEAIIELKDFLFLAKSNHWQSVRLITGKGINSTNGKAIIKETVIDWLVANKYKFIAEKGGNQRAGSLIVKLV